MIARKFLISGIVQGVGYRYFAQRAAARHQVVGYVRNLTDGRVEAWAQGGEKQVEAFRNDLQTGPLNSRVEQIEETVIEPSNTFSSFRVEK